MSARTRWVAGILGLLGLSLGIHAILIVMALSDPSFAVEPDYERRAADWDTVMHQASANARLGWAVDARIERHDPAKPAVVSVVVKDDAEEAVPGASVRVRAFHNARASEAWKIDLTERGAGTYDAPLVVRRPGVWVLEITIEMGGDRYTKTIRRSVSPAVAGIGAPR